MNKFFRSPMCLARLVVGAAIATAAAAAGAQAQSQASFPTKPANLSLE